MSKTAEALLAALGLTGDMPVSAWPEAGWPEEDEEFDSMEDWVVGVAKYDWDGPYFQVRRGSTPGMWKEIATVTGQEVAEALAAHLNALLGRAP